MMLKAGIGGAKADGMRLGRIRQGIKVTVWVDPGADKGSVTSFGKRENSPTSHFLPLKT